jgi:predicted nucleic acid-binding protein
LIGPRPVTVVDASAIAALLFGEPEAEDVARRLEGRALVAPALLRFELASVCLKKLLRLPELRSEILRAFDLLERLPIQVAAVDHVAVIGLAQQHGLSTYDAAYLWLARALGAPLETLDGRLRAVAS